MDSISNNNDTDSNNYTPYNISLLSNMMIT